MRSGVECWGLEGAIHLYSPLEGRDTAPDSTDIKIYYVYQCSQYEVDVYNEVCGYFMFTLHGFRDFVDIFDRTLSWHSWIYLWNLQVFASDCYSWLSLVIYIY